MHPVLHVWKLILQTMIVLFYTLNCERSTTGSNPFHIISDLTRYNQQLAYQYLVRSTEVEIIL